MKTIAYLQFFQDRRFIGDAFFFSKGERMKPVVMISSLKGIPPKAVVVKTRTAGDQNFEPAFLFVVEAFQVIPPSAVLVNLVKDQRFGGRESSA